ncbi:RidA family protein [Teichococcus vastitatis]|jgi:enamine deaminase RidA (YjgF/YER057c/UK114 family)|uniref:RidA family protein n=1 Tax=Teichococcus vastitatis TaxID=2307076 RepID=A0ABS9WB38_9PROT|nr:RidA family protein [Pseudoroseomonas vastitatis]MCI0756517.1 RidA family protein [Pseudoroseomonas vastitatis]
MIERITRTPIMHRVVAAHGVLYLGGIVAEARDGVGMKGQTEQALARMEEILRSAGSDRTKVLTATVYVTDMAAKAEMNEAWVSFFGAENLPSRATVGVANLGSADTLIEVVATALKG